MTLSGEQRAFTLTNERHQAHAFPLTPSFVQQLCDWRARYGIEWTPEPCTGDPLPRDVLSSIARSTAECPLRLRPAMRDVADWKAFVDWMLDWCGMGFHPDSDIVEYVDAGTGKRSFDPEFAERVLQPLLDHAREILTPGDLYDVAFEQMRRRFPGIGSDFEGP